jgi:hypothetical protein
MRAPIPRDGDGLSVSLKLKSQNTTTGPIPVTMSDPATCPNVCPYKGGWGCYAEGLPYVRHHWANVPWLGMTWPEFVARVALFPLGQLWRHAEAGDLPGRGDVLDLEAFGMLVRANRGKRGHTFTHKPLDSVAVRAAILAANRDGFTVNLSANSLEHADELASLQIGPVAVVLPQDAPSKLRTPGGRKVAICPAETGEHTCLTCQRCSASDRPFIVGFRAHGNGSPLVTEIVRSRRPVPNAPEVSP